MCWALEDARREGQDLAGAVERSLGWDRVADDARVLSRALGPDKRNGLDELIARRTTLRRAARVILEAFVLRSFKPSDPILVAVDLLRSVYRGELRSLPTKVPVVFLKRRWRERVRAGTSDFDPRAWEVAVLVHLRDRLRSGDVWVEGSRAFRSFEDYLLPRPVIAFERVVAVARERLRPRDREGSGRAPPNLRWRPDLRASPEGGADGSPPQPNPPDDPDLVRGGADQQPMPDRGLRAPRADHAPAPALLSGGGTRPERRPDDAEG